MLKRWWLSATQWKPKPLEKSTFFEQYPYVVSAPLPLRSTTISKEIGGPTTFALGEGVEVT
jgi:hypothetical protein